MIRKCVIIPALNEEENIVGVIEKIKQHTNADIIVIDDGSSPVVPLNEIITKRSHALSFEDMTASAFVELHTCDALLTVGIEPR